MTIGDAFPGGLTMDALITAISGFLSTPVVPLLVIAIMALFLAPKFSRQITRVDRFYKRVGEADERRGWTGRY